MIRWSAVPATARSSWIALSIGLAVLGQSAAAPAIARAHHPLVDEGRRLYEEAEFVAALDALGRAEAARDLAPEDLAVLFETRALVRLAMRDEEAMRADLRRLVAIAPDHRIGAGAHPDVMRALAEVRASGAGSPRVVATASASPSGVTIEARAENDWAGVVRSVRATGRVQGAAAWESATDAGLFVTAAAGDVVEYHLEAIGPGGVVVARSGSEAAPLRAGAGPAVAAGGGLEAWPFLVAGGAALLVGAVIVIAVVMTQDGGTVQTDVAPFTVRF